MHTATPNQNGYEWRGGRLADPHATPEERNQAMLAHLLGLLGLIDHFVLGLIGVVVLHLATKGRSPFVDDHAREAINFQLSLLVYELAAGVLIVMTLGLGVLVVLPALLALWIIRLVVGIRGAVAANRGEFYRYPLCIRFLG
ncbi:MAG: DUF4870 domain-containing protein [Planctomycetota bacterium]|nr:MAG: DUF4870 domain-containing protein [Planctomycetota bacterium]